MTESPLVDSGFAVPVFSPGDDPIALLNKAMTISQTVYFHKKARIQKRFSLANIPTMDTDVSHSNHISETYLKDMENQSVYAMQDFEQTPTVDFTDNRNP
ncbi:hypothetical protein Tco_0469186 [Tanacetum coccineum]